MAYNVYYLIYVLDPYKGSLRFIILLIIFLKCISSIFPHTKCQKYITCVKINKRLYTYGPHRFVNYFIINENLYNIRVILKILLKFWLFPSRWVEIIHTLINWDEHISFYKISFLIEICVSLKFKLNNILLKHFVLGLSHRCCKITFSCVSASSQKIK